MDMRDPKHQIAARGRGAKAPLTDVRGSVQNRDREGAGY
jgi:hypothetical protein